MRLKFGAAVLAVCSLASALASAQPALPHAPPPSAAEAQRPGGGAPPGMRPLSGTSPSGRWAPEPPRPSDAAPAPPIVTSPAVVMAADTRLAAPHDERARPVFEAGRRAYEAGRYADALDAFQRVFVMTGHPTMLINIANAHVRLAEPRRAAAALRQYLALVPEASNRAALEARIAELQEAPLVIEPRVARLPGSPEPPARGLIAGRTFTWVALGTSAVFAGVAGVLWVNANQSFERLALTCGVNGTCSADQIATVSGGVHATNLCLAASGAALGLAALLFFVEGGDDHHAPRVSADVRADSASLSITGRL